ncbi:hypothetical protein RJ641_010363 [Dillenia turbinata]|uniref:RIN4 pathogenic type III effector avirulence factor Avr cleavage site domain-containing protein n=1 Tax=Dillenia turbinata TaxID=194707 RepID=A0AAN8VAF8_9MAGN
MREPVVLSSRGSVFGASPYSRLLLALSSLMEDRKEKNAGWLSVPQFGDWDHKGEVPDYSLDFSKIREMRKQNKMDVSRASLGNEEELMASTTSDSKAHLNDQQNFHQNNSPTPPDDAMSLDTKEARLL